MTTTLTHDVSASERQVPVVIGFTYVPGQGVRTGGSYTAGPGLDVVVEHNDGRWVFRDRVTGIYGHGPTPWEAARDFRRALHEHRDVLERQGALTEHLQLQLEYLRERV